MMSRKPRLAGAVSSEPALLTVPEVADVMRVSVSTVKRMVASGRLPVARVGSRSIRVRRAVVLAILGNQQLTGDER
jgi:excisionase family DNA binding protein